MRSDLTGAIMKLFSYVLGVAFYLPMAVGFFIAYIAYTHGEEYTPIIGVMILTLGVSFLVTGMAFYLLYKKFPHYPDRRICTCHPDERPPVCMRQYATSDCIKLYNDMQEIRDAMADKRPPRHKSTL